MITSSTTTKVKPLIFPNKRNWSKKQPRQASLKLEDAIWIVECILMSQQRIVIFDLLSYVRQELEALYHLFSDKPALLGPKIQILWAALSLAKEEIFWYFRHVDAAPPEKLKKHYKVSVFQLVVVCLTIIQAEDFKDKRISSLLHLVDQVVAFVNNHRRVIMTYYLEYMCTLILHI